MNVPDHVGDYRTAHSGRVEHGRGAVFVDIEAATVIRSATLDQDTLGQKLDLRCRLRRKAAQFTGSKS
jgi:hypothetical protein